MGVYNIINKAKLPLNITNHNSSLVINESSESTFKKDDVIIKIANLNLKSIEEVEVFLDGKLPGEEMAVLILKKNQPITQQITLTNFYTVPYVIIAVFVGLLFFIVAIIVVFKCDNVELATTHHWAFIFTAIIIMMTWGNYSKLPYNLGALTRLGFHVGYLFAPVFFLKFSIVFPTKLNIKKKNIFLLLNITSIILCVIITTVFFLYIKKGSVNYLRTYIVLFDICSTYIVLIILTAILIFAHTYTTTSTETDRKKLRWIILGFILGPLGYLALWVVPSRIWNQPFVPEFVVLLLVAFVPITFGIAIIKYRLLNIDIIFKRGLVYSFVISMLVIVYIVFITALASLFNNPNSEILSIVGAISIALLFQPAKVRVQKLVNKKFFRIEYDYRLALNLFYKEIKEIYNVKELITKVIEFIDQLIPVNKIGYFLFDGSNNTIKLIDHKNLEFIFKNNLSFKLHNKSFNDVNSVATANSIEHGVEAINKTIPEFEKMGVEIIFVIKSSRNTIYGFLVLGEKKSETKFTAEDFDLLKIITSRLSLTIERIVLQEEVIREHLEAERLEELNKVKSYFVSSVSHDLKTPLTSIKLFTERLKSTKNLSSEKKHEYLKIIEGESDRLTRLINNVLDYSKIEQGIQNYKFRPTKLTNQSIHIILL